MEKYKVCLSSIHNEYTDLTVKAMKLSGDSLYVKFDNNLSCNIRVDDNISIAKTYKNNYHDSIKEDCKVLSKISNCEFIIEKPSAFTEIKVQKNLRLDILKDIYGKAEWPGHYNLELTRGCGITTQELATAKRRQELIGFELEVRNDDILSSYTIDNFFIDDNYDSVLDVYCSEDEYNIINSNSAYLSINNNPYYCVEEDTGVCHLWTKYTDDSTITWFFDDSNIKINLGSAVDNDMTHLNMEYAIHSIYEDEYKEGIIPDIPNLEKVRLEPVLIDDDKYDMVNELSFIFHFRDRARGRSASFEESWHVTDNKDKLWNTIDVPSAITPTNDYFFKSDLVSYLNFDDDDVRYQKDKIKKTFIRLSFYNSNEPMSQSLLGYSTVFFDSNVLFSEYNKISNAGLLKDGTRAVDFSGNEQYPYDEYCITSKIDITNNSNTEKSSEGFYIYLFKNDMPKENEEKTIYMKVEFNHAKYGRTLPMIAWPMENNIGIDLSTSNFFENLYIPIKIKYINDRYVYCFEDKKNGVYSESVTDTFSHGNVSLRFVLFEPVLTK